MKITVERHRWHRGKGFHQGIADENGEKFKSVSNDPRSTIPNPNYTLCALGFGYNSGSHKSFAEWVLDEGYDITVSSQVVEINDDPKITEIEREVLLKKEFKKYGHEIEFVD